MHHCNTVISQNLADTRVGTSTGGVQSACFYGSLTCLSRCLRPQFRPLHPDERVCNPARNEIRVLTLAEPPHVVAQRTARPGEVRPPMADALHACAAACHAPRCFRQVELVMPLKLQQLSATRARDGRSVEWPVCVLWRTSAHAPWRRSEDKVSWLLSHSAA